MEKNENRQLVNSIAYSEIILNVKKLQLTELGTPERATLLEYVAHKIGNLSLNINRIEDCELDMRHERFEVVKMLHANVRALIEQRKQKTCDGKFYIEPRMAKELSNIVITILTDKEKADRRFVESVNDIHKHLRSIALAEYKKHMRK